MQALLVVDAQNEFSERGLRAVPNHAAAIARISEIVEQTRQAELPIAWIKHHNTPSESRAFVPGSWGADLSNGFGPREGHGPEKLFQKDVFGAFTKTQLEEWLGALTVSDVLIVGFYAHMCVSTSAREALVRGFGVAVDLEGTGACDISTPGLGFQRADEVRRSALLQLAHMGVTIRAGERLASPPAAMHEYIE